MAAKISSFDDEITMITLQVEEFDLFARQDKGKYRVDDVSDFRVALRISAEELQAYKDFVDDHKLAQSIGTAVHEDEAVIAALTSEDLRVYQDRRVALRLSEEDVDPQEPRQASESDPSFLNEWLSCMADTVVANASIATSDEEEDQAGPSTTFTERQADLLAKLSEGFTCNVCHERRSCTAMVRLLCDHRYCIDCTKALFVRATHDETLFPPRCCKKPLDAGLVKKYMTPEELAAYDSASEEFVTVNRVYCSNRQCGKFLPPALMNAATGAATCRACDTHTCCICKSEYHEGSDCPDDPALRETRELALANGWQTCPGCNGLVQLRTGCNHMT